MSPEEKERAAFAAYIPNSQDHLRKFTLSLAEAVSQFVEKNVAGDEVERVDIAAALYAALFPDLVAGEDPALFPLVQHFPPPFFMAVKMLLRAACEGGVAVVLAAEKGGHAITLGRACAHCEPASRDFAATLLQAVRNELDVRPDRTIASRSKGQVH